MKNLFTLFLVTLTTLIFAQVQETKPVPAKRPGHIATMDVRGTNMLTNYYNNNILRSSESCDTSDVIDYNTYAQIVALNNGLTYVGALSVQAYVQEATSSQITLNSADNFLYAYVMEAFDTLVFPNYTTYTNTQNLQASYYTKTLKTSTITLDSVEVVLSISGDTVEGDGTMTNDSLVFQIYKIVNGIVSPTAVQRISYVGYNGLSQFFTGSGYITAGIIPVGYTFAQGEGFAVRADYYNTDTSSHCVFAYGQADSCTDLIYEGQSLGFSFAYPSPFINTAAYLPTGYPQGDEYPGNAFFGEIDSMTPTTAAVSPASNAFGYFSISSFPTNCAYTFTQDWQFLPFVTVTNNLDLGINGSNPLDLGCTGNATRLVAAATGDLGGAAYTWSSNVYGASNTAATTIYNPGTYDVTVTNSSGCSATASVVAQFANGASVTPSFTFPTQGSDSHICEGEATAFTNTSSDVTGYSSVWYFSEGPDSVISATSPSHTYTDQGVYTVTLILDSDNCQFATSETVSVENCTGVQNVTAFENSVNIIPNPSNGNVNITINDADKNVTITVYNIIGQTVRTYGTTESPVVFNKNMDLSALANGTYLVRIISGSKTATKKLVIAK